jgi:glucose-1-phosphate thymidylyltransferase
MKIIVPMAGMGKRMRPHTLTIPKPLIPVGGKPIVQRLVEDLAATVTEKIDEVAFIIGPTFGAEVEKNLVGIAEKIGAKGSIYYQEKAEGTAHAIYCAEPSLSGNLMVAFADTLFTTNYKVDANADGVIFVNKIEDPSAFGVVKINAEGHITDFVEKPTEFVSDLAIIGIYYFKDGGYLKSEIKHLLDNNIREKGEYQLTNALENMKNKGSKFLPGKVDEWLDCGNKDATVYTNQRVLELKKGKEELVSKSLKTVNSVIVEPCFIGEGVIIENSVIGPHVSVGEKTKISNSVVSNSIIQTNSSIQNKVIHNSMIGNFVELKGAKEDLSIGDYIAEK